MTNKVVRDEVTKVRTVVTIGPVDGSVFGTFGWFIGVRNRTGDRTKYGTCVICRRRFADDEPVHMVGNVTRNSKVIGNRLCCSPCAEVHATMRTGERAERETT
jgi:hypothetical protein